MKYRQNEILSEFKIVHKKLITCDSKVYAFSDGQRREISNELVFKYPECLLNVNMIDIDSRHINHEIGIDFHFKYLDEMIEYNKNFVKNKQYEEFATSKTPDKKILIFY